MIKKMKSYIIFLYFKYLLSSLFIFIGLIWLSQILRIIDTQFSISNQIIDILIATILVLPSFVVPLMPFLIIISSFFLSEKLYKTNESTIISQYLNNHEKYKISIILSTFILIIYLLNSEYFSVNLYKNYKIKELEIRNNLKLGSPSKNEFHIDDIISIFFENQDKDTFYDVEALIYIDKRFIKSKYAELEIAKESFNIVFFDGDQLILNKNEKSKTSFEKFTYVLKDKKLEKLLIDKDHLNTFELLNSNKVEFKTHGHNKIFQLFFLIYIFLISNSIVLFRKKTQTFYLKFIFLFFTCIIIYLINSYLVYLINRNSISSYWIYYLINFISLILFSISTQKLFK